MSRLNELRMIARVAQMYHVEGQRQADIAQHLRISQATVSRMLKKAVDEEIVRTTVVAPSGTYAELEAGLRSGFGLTEAIVVECSEDRDGAIMARIGEAAAPALRQPQPRRAQRNRARADHDHLRPRFADRGKVGCEAVQPVLARLPAANQ